MRGKTLAFALSLAVFGLDAGTARADERPVTVRTTETPVAKSVTLDEAVKRALAHNPTAEVAAKEIDRVEGLMQQVRAGWIPTLDANATYTRLDDDRALNGRITQPANAFNANLRLNVPIVAPRQWVRYSQSKAEVGIARAAFADNRREVALAAARAYLTVVAQHRVLVTARAALDNTRAHETYTTTRFTGGVGNRLDAARASQERATAEVRLSTQLTQLARAQEALGVVIGEEGAVDAAQDPSFDVPTSMDSALGEVDARRTDIRAQRDRAELARKVAEQTWADYMPVLSASFSPFYQNPATFTNPTTGWTAQLVLGIPIFDGGSRFGLSDERKALEAAARARLDGVLRQARSEVRIAFEAMRRADEALASAREAAKLGKEALELAQLAYGAGATSNIEVVDAERRSQDADTSAAVAEDASRQARLDLLAACGRFP